MPDQILDSTSTTSVLTVGGATGASTVDFASDQDWWRVSLVANTTYQFRLNGNGLSDPYLRLMNSSGIELAHNDDSDGSFNSLITYTPATNTTCYLSAQGYSGYTGGYLLMATSTGVTTPTLTPTPTGDILNSTSTTSVLTVGGATGASTVDFAGDQDWWRVSLVANTTYQFRLNGNGLSDPYLRLMNSSGIELAHNDDSDGSFNSLITYTPATNTTCYLSAQGYSGYTGDYLLTATSTGATTPAPNDTLAPTLLRTTPNDDASSTAVASNITLTFNEAIRAGSGNIELFNLTKNGGRLISVEDTSQVTFSGSQMTINPATDISDGSRFEVRFGSGVVMDLAGNAFDGLTSGNLEFQTSSAMIMPITGAWRLDQGVGAYYHHRYADGLHPGEDWNLGRGMDDIGQATLAVANGTVISANNLGPIRGSHLVIQHTVDGQYLYSHYVHVDTWLSVGDIVGIGAEVALLHDTDLDDNGRQNGSEMSSHLHFELRSTPDLDWSHGNSNGYYTSDMSRKETSPEQGGWSRSDAYQHMQDDGILMSPELTPVQPSTYIADHLANSEQRTAGNSRLEGFNLGALTEVGQRIERHDWVGLIQGIGDVDYYKVHIGHAGRLDIDFGVARVETKLETSDGVQLDHSLNGDSTLSYTLSDADVNASGIDLYIKVVGSANITSTEYAMKIELFA